MVDEDPGRYGAGSGGNGAPRIPDAVWRKFLGDNERAIRASAPRELSARERATGVHPGPAGTEGSRRRRSDASRLRPVDAVGDLWEPEDRWPGPAWRDMDGPARRRHVGRILAAVAAVALAVGALSLGPSESGVPGGTPGDATTQQSEDVLPDGVPTWTDPTSTPAQTDARPPTPRTE